MSEYAHPTALVTAEWAQQHISDAGVRFVEVDVDTEAYEQGHIPGAVGWNWETLALDDGSSPVLMGDGSACGRTSVVEKARKDAPDTKVLGGNPSCSSSMWSMLRARK